MVRQWLDFLDLKNEIKKWIKLSNFSSFHRILIFILSFLFLFVYSTSHVNHDFALVKENNDLKQKNEIMLNYISILEKGTMRQMQEIYDLKKRCN